MRVAAGGEAFELPLTGRAAAVPMRHAVTHVASVAARDRLSVAGWLRSHQAADPQG